MTLPSAPPLIFPDRRPTALDNRWPGPSAAPSRIVLGTAAAAGAVAGIALPTDRPGIGWLIAGIAVVIAVVLVRRREPASPTISRWLWVGAALAVTAVGTFRAAEWLFTLCVLTACVAATLAIAPGRSVREMMFGLAAVPFGIVRAMPWAARGITALKERTGGARVRVTGSIVVTVVLVLVFGALFAGADATFARVVERIIPSIDGGSIVEAIILGGIAFVVTMGAVYWLAAPPDLTLPPVARKPWRPLEWALPVGALVAVFGLFVLVQLTVLFGGNAYVLRTSGLKAAEYARRGFWQLCVVTVLVLLVIGVTARRASVDTKADRIWLRAVLGSLTGLTLVVVASALTRMWAYQEAYGYTVLRLLVGACEVWLGVVCLMVLAAGVALRAPWLPRAIVGSAVLGLLVLAVLNPDGFVASSNVDRYERTGKIDVNYLSRLSVDAAPELARLQEPARSCVLSALDARLDRLGPDGWLAWNLGRTNARDVIGSRIVRPRDCG